jgi:hypothetical protein
MPKSRRVYLMPPGHRRALWLEFPTDGVLWHFHMRSLQTQYRQLRTAGLSHFMARWVIYDILQAGRHMKLGEGYK